MSIKRHYLDFEILPVNNPRTLVFLDSSTYMEQPERPLLEITLPGYNKYFLANIVAQQVNTLNSNTIGLTETLSNTDLADLPDGVWTFKYKICPYDKVYKQKYHLRTVTLETNLGKIYDHFELADCIDQLDDKIKKEVVDIILLIETGRIAAEKGQVKRANDAYTKANTKITNLLEKLDCNCG